MKRILFIFISLLLLAACNKETALQKFEQELTEQSCNIVAKNVAANWIVWWSEEQVLCFKDFNEDRQLVLCSLTDSIPADSIVFVSFIGEENKPIQEKKNVLFDVDSISVTLDNRAIVLFPNPYSDLLLCDNSCVLLALPSLNAVEINYPDSSDLYIHTYRIEYVYDNTRIFGNINFPVNTEGEILINGNSLMADVVRGDYELDHCFVPLMQLPKDFAIQYKEEIADIADVCNHIVALYNETDVYIDEFEDVFFVKAVQELLKYTTGSKAENLQYASAKDFIENYIWDIGDKLIRLALVRGEVLDASAEELVALLLSKHEDINGEIEKTLLQAEDIDDLKEMEDILDRGENQRIRDLFLWMSKH